MSSPTHPIQLSLGISSAVQLAKLVTFLAQNPTIPLEIPQDAEEELRAYLLAGIQSCLFRPETIQTHPVLAKALQGLRLTLQKDYEQAVRIGAGLDVVQTAYMNQQLVSEFCMGKARILRHNPAFPQSVNLKLTPEFSAFAGPEWKTGKGMMSRDSARELLQGYIRGHGLMDTANNRVHLDSQLQCIFRETRPTVSVDEFPVLLERLFVVDGV